MKQLENLGAAVTQRWRDRLNDTIEEVEKISGEEYSTSRVVRAGLLLFMLLDPADRVRWIYASDMLLETEKYGEVHQRV